MNIREYIKENILLFDGAMGTMLQREGLNLNKGSCEFNFTKEEIVKKIHKDYIDSGAKIITTNTFGCNRIALKNSNYKVSDIVKKSISLAKEAIGNRDVFIALDISPIGEFLEPNGKITFEEAVLIFREIAEGIDKGVIDVILIETMYDINEMKAAVRGVREVIDLPIFVTMTFNEDGKTFRGYTPKEMAIELNNLNIDGMGLNCSFFSKEGLKNIVREIKKYSEVPVIFSPNGGMPTFVNGKAQYKTTPKEFSDVINEGVKLGATIVGGCCGTTPEFIEEIKESIKNKRK